MKKWICVWESRLRYRFVWIDLLLRSQLSFNLGTAESVTKSKFFSMLKANLQTKKSGVFWGQLEVWEKRGRRMESVWGSESVFKKGRELKGELYFFLNGKGNPGTKEKREGTGWLKKVETMESVLKGSREPVELKKSKKCVQKRGDNWEN